MPKTQSKPQRQSIGIYVSSTTADWLREQPESAGQVIDRLVERARTAAPFPDVARLTLELRKRLDVIDDAIAEAQDHLSDIETAAGLVGEDGERIDGGG